jgi:hypothetical protein
VGFRVKNVWYRVYRFGVRVQGYGFEVTDIGPRA